MTRPMRQSSNEANNKPRRSRFYLTVEQQHALGAIAATLPKDRRNAFLLHVLASLKVAPHSVSDQQVHQAISNALAEHAA
jgi:hypothetical protein